MNECRFADCGGCACHTRPPCNHCMDHGEMPDCAICEKPIEDGVGEVCADCAPENDDPF